MVAYNDGEPGLVSVSFGDVEALGTTTLTRTIRVFNKGNGTATYNLAYVPITSIPGVSYSLSTTSVTVGAGQTANVEVTLTVDPSKMKHVQDPTVAGTQAFGSSQTAAPLAERGVGLSGADQA